MARSGRRWGWHQLDPGVARKLVADAQLPAGALVLDIGAGHGALTAPLLDTGHRVIAFELHPARADRLRDRFGDRAKVVRADVADLRLPRRPFHVVANPPYAVLAAVVSRLVHRGSRLESAHLLIPAWAAKRWAAEPLAGFSASVGPVVPATSFHPPPKSASRLLVIRRSHARRR